MRRSTRQLHDLESQNIKSFYDMGQTELKNRQTGLWQMITYAGKKTGKEVPERSLGGTGRLLFGQRDVEIGKGSICLRIWVALPAKLFYGL